MIKVAIVYFSSTSHTHLMAEAEVSRVEGTTPEPN